MSGNPFTIEEADIELTIATDPGIKAWIGGCAQRLTLTDEFQETKLQYPGIPFSKVRHIDESHKIEIENVWLLGTEVLPPLIPLIQRGQVYTLVIVWLDEDTGIWNKRTYYGVTGQVQRIGEASLQNLTYVAEQMIPEAGTDEFSMTPTPLNQVIYVEGQNRVPLYRYDSVSGLFTPTDPSLVPGLAQIEVLVDRVNISIGGTLALRATAAKTSVAQLIASGLTALDDSPRLEFWLGSRVASLSKTGKLAVGNVSEIAGLDEDSAFRFGPVPWAAIGTAGLFADNVAEDL